MGDFVRDARHWQLAVLSSLLAYGWSMGLLAIVPVQALLIPLVALLTQWGFSRVYAIPFEWRSAVITSLSLIILLRTNEVLLAGGAAFVAMASKFLIRCESSVSGESKHLFNPANFALVMASLFGGYAWISPGQWGQELWFAVLLALAGVMMILRVRQSDVTFAFLGFYALLLFARALYLGDPLTIPLHQLQSGALLLFAFFMISDPKTTPNHRVGRVLFACLVALVTFILQFAFYVPVAMMYALIICIFAVPWLDKWFADKPYVWKPEKAAS